MATRREQLAMRISHLQLKLAPLVPLPAGDPHPDFPRSLLDYHLLTEEQLDSIAHYYHQSTPSVYTMSYPTCMNWDKEYLANRRSSASQNRRPSQAQLEWWNHLINPESDQTGSATRKGSAEGIEGLTDTQRIAIKRRKVGKFIGLIGMDTPAEEIGKRIVFTMEQAIKASREELRRLEEWELRWKKI